MELAKAEFGDDEDDLARTRLELADHLTELGQTLTHHAAAFTDLGMLPRPRPRAQP